jgi:hypothetical protein
LWPAAVLLLLLAAISLLAGAIVILGSAISLRPALALPQRGRWAERGPELVVCVHQPSPTGSCLTLL